ncbi:MAG: hypothetical protein U0P30_11175 [Vicinamibacterales bacterium]
MRRAIAASALFILIAMRPASAQDAFEQRRARELAAMTGVDPIYLTFLRGRTTYRIGEPIPLRVEFLPLGNVGVVDQGCPGAGLQVVLDRTDVTTPVSSPPGARQGDWECGVIGGAYGGRVANYDALGIMDVPDLEFFPQLVQDSMELTADVRFTTPGRYRFYVRSRFDTPQSYGTPPRLSNILTIDIVARDAAWEAVTLARARADLESGDVRRRGAAIGTLALLGTDGAIDIAARAPGDALTSVAVSAEHQRYAVSRMLEQLDEVNRPIDWRFLWTLAALDAAPARGVAPARSAVAARLRTHSVRRLRALADAGRLADALAAEMGRLSSLPNQFERVRWELPAAGFPAFAPQVSRAVEALPASGQRRLLVYQSAWREFTDPSFLPMWRRLAASRAEGGVQDIAWAMWRRLEPQAADHFARREIRLPESRLGANGLPGLAVSPSATLDAALAARLEAAATPEDLERAASLVERFATARAQARVNAVLAASPLAGTCPVGPILLAYLFRVAPDAAVRHLDDVSFAPYEWGEPCSTDGVLGATGTRYWSATVERAAIRRLAPGPAAHAIDAAEALARHGSAASKAALLDALDAWHLRWSAPAATHAEDSDGRDWANAAIEAIANALEENPSWRLSEAEATRISSRFINRRDQDRWASSRWTARHPADIRVQPPRNPGDAPTFFVTHAWLTGVEPLLAQLRELPADRPWIWEPAPGPYLGFSIPYPAQPTSMWFPGQEEALFGQVRRRARAFGQTVRRP